MNVQPATIGPAQKEEAAIPERDAFRLRVRIKAGGVTTVWDYANDCAVEEHRMPRFSARWEKSELSRW